MKQLIENCKTKPFENNIDSIDRLCEIMIIESIGNEKALDPNPVKKAIYDIFYVIIRNDSIVKKDYDWIF